MSVHSCRLGPCSEEREREVVAKRDPPPQRVTPPVVRSWLSDVSTGDVATESIS
jgi:hypothetical protein